MKLSPYEAVAPFPKFMSPATTKFIPVPSSSTLLLPSLRNLVLKYHSHYKCSKERIKNVYEQRSHVSSGIILKGKIKEIKGRKDKN